MPDRDPQKRLAYRRALNEKVRELIEAVLGRGGSTNPATSLYDMDLVLAFADAGASLNEDIDTVLAYFVCAESSRALKRFGRVKRLISPSAKTFHEAHEKMHDASLKWMATFANGPAAVDRFQIFTQATFSYQMENGLRELQATPIERN